MAIPTDFKGPTPAASTTKSHKLHGSTTVGWWMLDIDGTLTATSKRIELAPNMTLFMSAVYTDAQIAALLKAYLANQGALNDGSGGRNADATKQVAVSATTCT